MLPNIIDFIIRGQGIAGSLLAWFLMQAGKKVMVVDPAKENTCSRVAAGLIHPVTGRRIVKSWNANLFIPFARHTYTGIEDKLAARFFEDFPVLEVFNDAGHRNDWAGRSAEPEMKRYISEECGAALVPEGICAEHGGRWVLNGGWLDTKRFLDTIQKYLVSSGSFTRGSLEYEDVIFKEEHLRWKDIVAKKMIDCTGADALRHPLLNDLPFNPCKGELLQIRAQGLPKNMVIHGPVKIIPLGGLEYLTGATYDFNRIDEITTNEGREKLEHSLQKLINVSYTVSGHFAAIRPSTKDRRPVIGRHKFHKNLFVFNGLGSKGVMMAPWLAKHLTEYLLHNLPLEKELDPYR